MFDYETISDETLSDETLSDETLSDETLSNETLSDESVVSSESICKYCHEGRYKVTIKKQGNDSILSLMEKAQYHIRDYSRKETQKRI